ncbi:hypothetical protein [Bacillus cereus]|uniref:Zinc-ribbon domain-containing protein n=1 Tax=Bacillus cereus HuA4-10 TaxID=1053206 RepID=J8AQW4_BACCE|nr:hypothetical protein [Bacillus cereus]EJQ84098.1 hypothetical protein IGC_01040 [Bacillus cereus HuA4-10]
MREIKLEDGKYTVVNELSDGGGLHALRYGEEWRNLAGDNLILAMFHKIEELQNNKDVETVNVQWTPAFQSYHSAGDESEPFCDKCEKYLDIDFNYCPDCGSKLDWGGVK